jgi:hypothetical protein
VMTSLHLLFLPRKVRVVFRYLDRPCVSLMPTLHQPLAINSFLGKY